MKGKEESKKTSKSSKAGLLFPVGRVMKNLRKMGTTQRISQGASIHLTAVLEYFASEVLELAMDAAKANKGGRVTPRHILLAIRNDEELSKMLAGVTFSQSGVVPHIEPALMPVRILKKKENE